MVNIVAKREENGVVVYLKSEFGNIFSRDVIIETLKKGHEYYVLSKKGIRDKIYLIETDKGKFLTINKDLSSYMQRILTDEIGELTTF